MLEDQVYEINQSSRMEGLGVIIKFAKASQLLPEALKDTLFYSIVPLASVVLMYNFKQESKKEQEELRKSMSSQLRNYLTQYGADYLNSFIEKLDTRHGLLFPEKHEEVKNHNKAITDTIDFIFSKCMPDKNIQENEGKLNHFVAKLIVLKSKCPDAAHFVDKRLSKLVDEKKLAENSPSILETIVQHVQAQLISGSIELPNDGMRDLAEELLRTQNPAMVDHLLQHRVFDNAKAAAALFNLVASMVELQ